MQESQVTFLLVDDDNAANFLNRRVIESVSEKIPVLSVSSAAEALKHFELRKQFKNSNRCMVVLLDINMPTMDGFEFLQVMGPQRPDFSEIKFIMLTSSENKRDVQKAQSLRVDGYIAKPLSREKVIEILNDVDYKSK